MIRARVIKVFRKNNNRIYGYRLQDNAGNIKDIKAEQLKEAIKKGLVQIDNYKLTSNNKLIVNKDLFSTTESNLYLLMNKNRAVAEFSLYFGITNVYGILPYDFDNIQEWIETRKKFSCARDVKKFFKTIGIERNEDMIEVTHCVSLHDTFWVKRKESNLCWEYVSPYRNNYSEVISTYALEGIYLGNTEKNYFSPVVGTDGSFPHTWKYSKDGIKFIKAGSKYTLGGYNSGREPYSEYYASIVSEYLGFNHVKYNIRNHKRHDGKTDVVTECDCFTSDKIGTVTANILGLNTYEDVIEYCKKLGDNSYKTCIDMFFLDCLLLNTDRHFSNIEFFMNNDSLKVIGMAPIFDNNCSFLPRFIEGYDVFNREEYVARDGRTFDELYKLVKKNKSFNKELIKLKKLKLDRPDKVEIKDERLKFLNWLLQLQIDYLLSN